MLTRDQAIELLGDYAINQNNGKLLESRIIGLIEFSKSHEQVDVVSNNNWSKPPTPSKWTAYKHIGGTTYRYQVWAVAVAK
jgi:hypothetical protein